MRKADAVFSLILEVARRDDCIRAVCLNGSRANPHIAPDPCQDYDLTFYVTETDSYARDRGWVDVFGNRLIMQIPDGMDLGTAPPLQ